MNSYKERRKTRELHAMCESKEYSAWRSMIQRCINTSIPQYLKDYQQKGITIDPEFLNSFIAFYTEVGPCPGLGYSVERCDNNRGYEPGNIRWATMAEQNRNKSSNVRIEYRGRMWLLCDLAKFAGVEQKLLRTRLKQGIDLETALLPISLRRNKKTLKKYPPQEDKRKFS